MKFSKRDSHRDLIANSQDFNAGTETMLIVKLQIEQARETLRDKLWIETRQSIYNLMYNS